MLLLVVVVVVRSSSTVVVVVDSIVGSWGLVPDPNPHSDGTIMPLQSSGMAQWYTLARTVSDVAEMWALFGLDGRATFLWVAASALMSFWIGNDNFYLPSNMADGARADRSVFRGARCTRARGAAAAAGSIG